MSKDSTSERKAGFTGGCGWLLPVGGDGGGVGGGSRVRRSDISPASDVDQALFPFPRALRLKIIAPAIINPVGTPKGICAQNQVLA